MEDPLPLPLDSNFPGQQDPGTLSAGWHRRAPSPFLCPGHPTSLVGSVEGWGPLPAPGLGTERGRAGRGGAGGQPPPPLALLASAPGARTLSPALAEGYCRRHESTSLSSGPAWPSPPSSSSTNLFSSYSSTSTRRKRAEDTVFFAIAPEPTGASRPLPSARRCPPPTARSEQHCACAGSRVPSAHAQQERSRSIDSLFLRNSHTRLLFVGGRMRNTTASLFLHMRVLNPALPPLLRMCPEQTSSFSCGIRQALRGGVEKATLKWAEEGRVRGGAGELL